MKEQFFLWISECCRLLGKDAKYGVILLKDNNWAAAWYDEMTPTEAVAEFKETYPDGYPKEIEDAYL